MAELRDSDPAKNQEQGLSLLLGSWLFDLRVEELFVTCLSCTHLGSKGASCNKYPGYPIPAHVVLTGCEDYKDREARARPLLTQGRIPANIHDDEIPF